MIPISDEKLVGFVISNQAPFSVRPSENAVGGWDVYCGDVRVTGFFGDRQIAHLVAEECVQWRVALLAKKVEYLGEPG